MPPYGQGQDKNPTMDQIQAIGAIPQRPYAQDISIRQVENGFIVTINCKSFVAATLSEIFEGLTLYFAAPDKAIEKYCRK